MGAFENALSELPKEQIVELYRNCLSTNRELRSHNDKLTTELLAMESNQPKQERAEGVIGRSSNEAFAEGAGSDKSIFCVECKSPFPGLHYTGCKVKQAREADLDRAEAAFAEGESRGSSKPKVVFTEGSRLGGKEDLPLHNPSGPEYLKHIDSFVEALHSKLQAGHHEYGDKSFSRDPLELVDEILEELLDINGWSFILRVRLLKIRVAIDVSGI